VYTPTIRMQYNIERQSPITILYQTTHAGNFVNVATIISMLVNPNVINTDTCGK